ncbi:PRP38 pre-mRNA processing factor 38 domain-containing protein B [Chytridiales sp. JEL 0842]|nr:PRP38 pre-mRNA processing factor 38 domain-containing protein B [Chytridiales sp. JEL 0842]
MIHLVRYATELTVLPTGFYIMLPFTDELDFPRETSSVQYCGTTGNETTMNLNNILYQNIISSPYFKSLYDKKTFHEVVDEIYNNVTSLEPFLKGTVASTAFCLLYKLWTLKLTIKQIENLVDHTDSPHIRAIGFLYLRYVCEPSDLWSWFEYYIDDEEEVQIEVLPKPKIVTIGKVCRDLLTEPKWLGTILPRIPVPIARSLEQNLRKNPPKNAAFKGPEKSFDPPRDDRRPPPPPASYRDDGYRGRPPPVDYVDELNYDDEPNDRRRDSRGKRSFV